MSKIVARAVFILILPLAGCATGYQTVEQSRQECWNEQVPVQAGDQGYGGAIIGGIAGGLLGNQVGGGSGRTAATAIGAITGAIVGDRMSSGGPSYRTVRRCRTVVDEGQVPAARQRVEAAQEAAPVVVEPGYDTEQPESSRRGEYRHRYQHDHDDEDD